MLEQNQQQLLQSLLMEKYEPIAICGIGLRAPGNNDSVATFKQFLQHNGDGIVEIPSDRWDNSAFYDGEDGKGKIRTNKGGYLKDIASFDAKFFNVSPKEADYLDPQQRLVLETAWEALEHAGIDADSLRGSNGGVFVGVSSIDYSLEVGALAMQENIGYIGTGTAHSAVSGRVSYFLGWRGPCVSIDTACSSSLVALHQAIVALRHKECNVALCGGVNAIHHPRNLVVFSDAKMLSPSGRCKTFDDSADGYGRSEGCSMIVLKRLSDAIKDGDSIIATLRGSAVNQDGESGGLTVPNGIAQEQVMRNAINNAALTAADIGYVEAHGTGTSLGDPIEVRAINSVFSQSHSKAQPIHIGSVKGNIGHTEAAAGIMGVVKAALQIQHGELFAHVSMNTPSRHIPWEDYVVNVPTNNQPWQAPIRRAMVNSFGFAGTIASVILEQAPPAKTTGKSQDQQGEVPTLITLSGKSRSALASSVEQMSAFLQQNSTLPLSDIAYASHKRSHFNHRLAFYSNDNDTGKALSWLQKQSQKLAENKKSAEPSSQKLAFLFTGQGSQYVGMGKGYYQQCPTFREALNLCDRIFKQHLNLSIKGIMFGEVADAEELLAQTQFTQAALFSIEYAMSRYWIALGLHPSCLIGHSIGEIVAACIAGVFSLEDAIKLVANRGRLMQSVTAKGGMLALKCTQAIATGYLAHYPQLGFAALNSPTQCVISGEINQLKALQQQLSEDQIDATLLNVSHAVHSCQMETIYHQFAAAISGIKFNEPEITLISNVSGEVAKFSEIGQPAYWVRHIGEPVRFVDGIKTLAERGGHLCLEVGPARSLCSLGRQTVDGMVWINSMSKQDEDKDSFGNALANLYQQGVSLDWQTLHKFSHYKPVQLPFYGFDRKYHWMTLDTKYRFRRNEETAQNLGHPLLGRVQPTQNDDRILYVSEISANQPAYLADHKVNGQVVFPGAGYIETLIAAQVDIFGEFGGQISEVLIHEPLFLTAESVQFRSECLKLDNGSYQVTLLSRVDNIDKQHVSATIHPPSEQQDKGTDLSNLDSVNLQQLSTADDLYPQFEQIGLAYGDKFQRLQKVRSDGKTLALAELESGYNSGEFVTASLLDCAMQSLAAIVEDGKTYLPIKFGEVYFYKQPRGKLSAVLHKTAVQHADLSADL